MSENIGIVDQFDGSSQITTPNGRYYTQRDSKNKYWSITTVIDIVDKSSWYLPWVLKKIKECFELTGDIDYSLSHYRRENKRICDRGTRVHDWIEAWCKGEDSPLEEGDEHFTVAFYDYFWSVYKVETISTEERLFNEKWLCKNCGDVNIHPEFNCCMGCDSDLEFIGYAGTYDWYGYIDGKLTILDWKTSKSIKDEYWMQLAAEVNAAPFKVEQVGIVRMKPETKSPRCQIVFKDVEELGPYWNSFKKRLITCCDVRRENAK